MQPCLKITNGSYNLLIKKLLHQLRLFRCCSSGDSTNARWTLITNPRLMINTRLFATVLERLLLFPFKTALWLDFVKASRGKFSKAQQINYSTVLPGFDLVQMAGDCVKYILTKNRLSDILSNEPPLKCPSSGGGGIYITSVFFFFLFLYLLI